ncbi:MAG: ABC transporter permease subunit [Candidatus Margulisiibacteriota bacterium]
MLSPQFREKLLIFKKDKKAYYSLIVLIVLFLFSLPAELLFNDKPLMLTIDGNKYYPFINEYSLKDFGGWSAIPITDYRSPELMNFLKGIHAEEEEIDIFGFGKKALSRVIPAKAGIQNEAPRQPRMDPGLRRDDEQRGRDDSQESINGKKSYTFIWAPVRHSHKSRDQNPQSGKENLASPLDGAKITIGDSQIEFAGKYGQIKSSWADGHYLGTDEQGKDVLARIVYGFRISMLFGLGLAISGTLIGTLIGALQGFFAGWVDLIGQRLTELWGSMPRLYLLIILSAFLAHQRDLTDSQHYWLLFGILNLTAWMGMAVYIRAEFLKSRTLDYVKAAKALGVSNTSIMRRHILPNSLTPIITFFPFEIIGGILALVSLDFLGLGVRYPAPSLGELLSQGQNNLHAYWIILPTFLVLTVTLMLLTFVGGGVRDAFDPRAQ